MNHTVWWLLYDDRYKFWCMYWTRYGRTMHEKELWNWLGNRSPRRSRRIVSNKLIQCFWCIYRNLKRWNGNIFRSFNGLRLNCKRYCIHSFISRLQISEKIFCINILRPQVPIARAASAEVTNCILSLCLADTFQLTLLPFKIDSRYYRACWRYGAIGCHIHNCFTNFNLFVSIFFLGNTDYK